MQKKWNWWRRWKERLLGSRERLVKTLGHSHRRKRCYLHLEALEDRILPSVIGFAQASFTTNEAAGGQATITVTRSATTNQETVYYGTSNGTALSGTDYNSAGGMLTFAPGQASANFNVSILDDQAAGESNEQVNLGLYNPGSGSSLNPNLTNATLAIVEDNDAAGTVAGSAWQDTNGDGIRESGESGLGGVGVGLYSGSGSLVNSTTTASNGRYQFSWVNAGTYSVRFTPPGPDFTFSPQHQGTNDNLDSDVDNTGASSTFTVGSGTNTEVDAGLVPTAPLTLTPSSISATEGATFNGQVGSFSDGDPSATISDFQATITWSDNNSQSPGVVTSTGNGQFAISASHNFEEGVVNFGIALVDKDSNHQVSANGTATVADASLSSTAANLTPPAASEGVAFGPVTVFHFSDADPGGSVGDYLATVNTGTSTLTSTANPTNVTIVANANGGFDVELAYTYAQELSGAAFSVSVTDHNSSASQSSSFSVADAPPLLAVTSAPTSIAENTATTAGGTFSDYDDNVTSLSASEGTVTPAAPGSTSGSWSWSESGPLTDGAHTVTITAKNADGTTGSTSFTFTVSDVAPTVSVSSSSSSVAENSTATASGSFSDYDANVTLLWASEGTVTPAAPGSTSGTWSWSESAPLTDGAHTVTITAKNADGTIGSTTFTFSVSDVAPTVSVSSSSSSVAENSTATASGSFSDYDDNVTSLSASEGTVTPAAPGSASGTWSWSESAPLSDGWHTVTITAKNADGTTGSTSFTFTVSDVNPMVAADHASVSASENTSASNTGTWSDFDDAVTLTASAGNVIKNNNGTWSWSGTGDESSPYSVTITATNSNGLTATATFTASLTDVPPAIAADHSTVSVAENATTSNTGTFSDFDDAVTVSQVSGPVGQISQDNNLHTWTWTQTATVNEGDYTVELSATNADGLYANVTFTLHVTDAKPSVAAGNPTVSANEGTTLMNTGTFSDVDEAVSIGVSGGDTVSQNGTQNGTWTWTGTGLEEGSYPIIVTATNTDGSQSTVSFTATVNDVAVTVNANSGGTLPAINEGTATAASAVIGTFTDNGNPAGTIDTDQTSTQPEYKVVIAWADGATDTLDTFNNSGAFQFVSGGTFQVRVPAHTYADEAPAPYSISMTVTHDGLTAVGPTPTASVTVNDASLSDTSLAPNPQPSAIEGTVTSLLTLATFTDANPGDHTTDFTATVHWGDGISTGTVSYNGNNSYSVTGSHIYSEDNSVGYAVTVDVQDDGNQNLFVIGKTVVTVTEPPINATSVTLTAVNEGDE